MVMLRAAKVICVGIAVSAISGAGVGIGTVFGSLINVVSPNPGLTNQLFSHTNALLRSTVLVKYYLLGLISLTLYLCGGFLLVFSFRMLYFLFNRQAVCDSSNALDSSDSSSSSNPVVVAKKMRTVYNNGGDELEIEDTREGFELWWDLTIEEPLKEFVAVHPVLTMCIVFSLWAFFGYHGRKGDD